MSCYTDVVNYFLSKLVCLKHMYLWKYSANSISCSEVNVFLNALQVDCAKLSNPASSLSLSCNFECTVLCKSNANTCRRNSTKFLAFRRILDRNETSTTFLRIFEACIVLNGSNFRRHIP